MQEILQMTNYASIPYPDSIWPFCQSKTAEDLLRNVPGHSKALFKHSTVSKRKNEPYGWEDIFRLKLSQIWPTREVIKREFSPQICKAHVTGSWFLSALTLLQITGAGQSFGRSWAPVSVCWRSSRSRSTPAGSTTRRGSGSAISSGSAERRASTRHNVSPTWTGRCRSSSSSITLHDKICSPAGKNEKKKNQQWPNTWQNWASGGKKRLSECQNRRKLKKKGGVFLLSEKYRINVKTFLSSQKELKLALRAWDLD